MSPPPDTGRALDRVILLFLFAVLAFNPPLSTLWTQPESPWYAPYLVWLVIIVLSAWLHLGRNRL